jgi:hypothetical protein
MMHFSVIVVITAALLLQLHLIDTVAGSMSTSSTYIDNTAPASSIESIALLAPTAHSCKPVHHSSKLMQTLRCDYTLL